MEILKRSYIYYILKLVRAEYNLLVIKIIIFYMICGLCFSFTFARDVYEIYYFLKFKINQKN